MEVVSWKKKVFFAGHSVIKKIRYLQKKKIRFDLRCERSIVKLFKETCWRGSWRSHADKGIEPRTSCPPPTH